MRIIPDQHLVALYTSNHRERRRKAGWVGAAGLAALVLCSLWGWSYLNNRATLASIAGELAQAKADDQAGSGQYTAWHSLDRLRFWTAHYYQQHHEQGVPLGMRLGLSICYDIRFPELFRSLRAQGANVILNGFGDVEAPKAAVLAAGHCGFGMGATPTAVANMQAITNMYGPSHKAFLIVPLCGAFFVDLINATVIQLILKFFA